MVSVTKANMLYIEKKGISEKALNKLKREADGDSVVMDDYEELKEWWQKSE